VETFTGLEEDWQILMSRLTFHFVFYWRRNKEGIGLIVGRKREKKHQEERGPETKFVDFDQVLVVFKNRRIIL